MGETGEDQIVSTTPLGRRQFLELAALVPALAAARRAPGAERGAAAPSPGRLFFTSQGKTAVIEATAGAKPRWLSLDAPGQETWQPGPFLPHDGRVIMLS